MTSAVFIDTARVDKPSSYVNFDRTPSPRGTETKFSIFTTVLNRHAGDIHCTEYVHVHAVHFTVNVHHQRPNLKMFMVVGTSFLGTDSSGGIYSAVEMIFFL